MPAPARAAKSIHRILIIRGLINSLYHRMVLMKTKHATLVQFGQNVRRAREAMGISQEKLASLADMDRTYVGGVERGERNASLLNICKIADALGISLKELVFGLQERDED